MLEGRRDMGYYQSWFFLNVSLKLLIKRKTSKNLEHFTKKGMQMANKNMKKRSASFSIREMQIKATRRYHCTLIRMAKIKNDDKPKGWGRLQATGNLIYY